MGLISLFFGAGSKLKIATLDAVLKIDVAVTENHQLNAQVTMNPVEQGVDITDHVQIQPRRVQIEGVVSDTPIIFLQAARTEEGTSRTQTTFGLLKQILQNKQLVTLSTGFESYLDLILTDLTIPRDVNTGSIMKFNASFVEIVVVESTLVPIPKGLGGAKQNQGKVQSKPASPSAGKGSILSEITGLKG